MSGRQASGPGARWGEVLWGALAGVGARVLLGGAARRLGLKSRPAAVGGMAGLVGAWVGGGLARRRLRSHAHHSNERAAQVASEGAPELRALTPERGAHPDESERLPRGPNGRERHGYLQEGPSHTA